MICPKANSCASKICSHAKPHDVSFACNMTNITCPVCAPVAPARIMECPKHDTVPCQECEKLRAEISRMLISHGSLLSDITFAAAGHRDALFDEQIVATIKDLREECEKLRAENDKLMDQLRNAEDYIKELNQPKGEG